jgi:hypothetical protein
LFPLFVLEKEWTGRARIDISIEWEEVVRGRAITTYVATEAAE